MKYGISISIDVTKIDKTRLAQGKYLNIQSFVDVDNKDKYENNGFITDSTMKGETKEELKALNRPILGNTRVFWSGESAQSTAPADNGDAFNDDIPF